MLRLLPLLAPLVAATDLRPEVMRSTTGVLPGHPEKKNPSGSCVGCFGAETRSTVTLTDLNGRTHVMLTSEPNCTVAEVKARAVQMWATRHRIPLDPDEVQIIDDKEPRVLTDEDNVDDAHQLILTHTTKETNTYMQGVLAAKIAEENGNKRRIDRGSAFACGYGIAGIGIGSCIAFHAVTDPKKTFATIALGLCGGHAVSKGGGTVAGGNLAVNVVRRQRAGARQKDYQSQLNLFRADQGHEQDRETAAAAAAAAAKQQPSRTLRRSTSAGPSKLGVHQGQTM